VRHDGEGRPPVTDGPFVETKDLIAGWYIIDVESWDRVVQPAGELSAAPGPGGKPIYEWLEVRPFLAASPASERAAAAGPRTRGERCPRPARGRLRVGGGPCAGRCPRHAPSSSIGSGSPHRLLPQSMTTMEEPIHQAAQQARQRESVKHLPERLSSRNRKRVPNLSSSYRNPMVKHEPELHMGSGASSATKLLPRMIRSLSSFHRKEV
jgi:YCII-related domain